MYSSTMRNKTSKPKGKGTTYSGALAGSKSPKPTAVLKKSGKPKYAAVMK